MSSPAIALITGASRGLGRNAALHLAAQGMDLILTYRTHRHEAESLATQVRDLGRQAVILPLDVGQAETFAGFAAEVARQLNQVWGRTRFDHLVNNAGVGGHCALADTTPEQFDELMRIHLKGPFFLTQALLPLINDGGRILNVSSGLTRFALPGYGAYAAMKGGIEVLTRYQAKELGARGITANVVAPGAIATDFGGGVVRDVAEVHDYIAGQTALGRVGQPDEIGPVVAMLLLPAGRWINAQRVEASGGMFL